MKLDHSYIKKLLFAIENADNARPYLTTIISAMGLNDINDEFLLHYEVLFDYGFICSPLSEGGYGNGNGTGILDFDEGEISWINVPLRLTAQGHEFIKAMEKTEVWEVIKSEFKEASIKTVFKVAGDLAEGFAKKKVEEILAHESGG